MEGEKEADATKRQQTNEQRKARQWAALEAGGGVAGHKVAKTKGSNVVVPPTHPLPRRSTPFSPNEQKLQINLLLLLAILCSAGARGWRRRQRTLLLIR